MSSLIPVVLLLGLLTGCATVPTYGVPGTRLERLGDEIMVCGQLFHTGVPVVLWTDPGGYDAYRAECKFTPDQPMPSKPVSDSPIRYSTLRRHLSDEVATRVRHEGWSLPLLREWTDLFVMHYDVCGTSRRCFKVLHDIRGLSVHFMLDVDGTIYQTLDLKERAWHAGSANDRSIGIEIANIGAYPDMTTLDKWYGHDDDGLPYLTLPEGMGDGGVRTAGFVARPARPEPVTGEIQGRALRQYDLTDAQYDSLIKLTATVCTVLPRIEADYPRDQDGRLRTTILSDDEFERFSGLLGHWHVSEAKVDPGPAFDWDRLIEGVDELLAN
ncbi:MAG: N-acetylmuramoyl-L-alanine amidase [Planctomycetes bacterium]|nr:N-acetylmuramoyl-L-alanine amidase [Planctomycetota bacterium]